MARPWSLKPAVVSGRSADPGLAAPNCNGVEWSKDRTQAAESVKKQDHSRRRLQSGFIQHTQNPHLQA